MAKQPEGMFLFPEIFTTTRKLSDQQFGALIRAGWLYQLEGTEYDGDDIAVDISFQFLSSQIERRNEANAKKAEAAKKRWKQDADYKSIQSDADASKDIQDNCRQLQPDAPILSNPILSNPILSIESKEGKPPAPAKQTKKSFGEFGWVKLTDDEYNRLLNDLGEAEVKRCIEYVDESAQSTGNKNKWRDWNLVLRKCSKQGWGLDRQNQHKRNQAQNGPRELDDDEAAAIRRMLREG